MVFLKQNVLMICFMRGDAMRTVNNVMKFTVIVVALAALFGCTSIKPQVDDGAGMAYHDADYRSEYANVFDFDSYEGNPYFAAAFLGYGDIMDFRNTYVKSIFKGLAEETTEKIQHFDFEGDECYLIVPRYKERVDITDTDGNIIQTLYQGEAFTVKCNVSDLYSNIEICTESGFGAYKFSPQIGGDGRLVTDTDVCDITDYGVLEENLYIQRGE